MMYFDHSTSASSDPKIIALRLQEGGAAVDCYWVLVEQMHREEEPLELFGNPVGFSVITHLVSASVSQVEKWVKTMLDVGLFFRCGDDGNSIASERVLANVERYHSKAETARQNGKKGGRPTKTKSVSASVSEKKANKTKQNKTKAWVFTNEKPNAALAQSAAENGADEQSKTPHCASCGSIATFDPHSMRFVCRECGALHEKEEVVFK